MTKAAARIGNTAKLICKASGAPNVTFSWSKNGTVLPRSSPEKYKMETKLTKHIHYTAILSIYNVVMQDYGLYGCTARNALDYAKTLVKLQKVSEPDPPIALIAVNATHDSITLSWTPGFDGGRLRKFCTDDQPYIGNIQNVCIFRRNCLLSCTIFYR